MNHINERKETQILEKKITAKTKSYLIGALIFLLISSLSFFVLIKNFKDVKNIDISILFHTKIIVFAIINLIIFYLSDTLRLYLIIRTLKAHIKFKYLLNLNFINLFVSGVTPFATGGGLAQIYFLKKHGIRIGKATAATTIRTILASVIIFLAMPSLLFFTNSKFEHYSLVIKVIFFSTTMLIAYTFLIYMLINKSHKLEKIVIIFIKFFRKIGIIGEEKFNKALKFIHEEIELFSQSIKLFVHGNYKFLILSIIGTIAFLISLFSFSAVLIRGLGYNISIIEILAWQILIIFIIYFTPTPGASGGAEGIYYTVFAGVISKTDVILIIFAWRFLSTYIGMIIGSVAFYLEIFKKSKSKQLPTSD